MKTYNVEITIYSIVEAKNVRQAKSIFGRKLKNIKIKDVHKYAHCFLVTQENKNEKEN